MRGTQRLELCGVELAVQVVVVVEGAEQTVVKWSWVEVVVNMG